MTTTLKIKDERFYAVINYRDGAQYKQKWITLGLPVKNNKRKAEAMVDKIRQEYEERYALPAGDMKYVAYLRQWLEKKKTCVQLSTWEGYQNSIEGHIIPYFEKMNLSLRDLKPHHFQDYYQYKYSGGRLDSKKGGLSVKSLKHHKVVIIAPLNDAVLSELIQRNPAAMVKLPAKDISYKEKVFLDVASANKVLLAFQGSPLQAAVYTTLYYGLRRSEVLGLRWSAVDFENNTLSINHTVVKNRTVVEKDTTKSQCSFHTYVLIEDVKEVLLRQREWQNKNRAEFGTAYHESDYIFTWEDGTLFRPDYLTRGFQRTLKRAGVPMMRFHDLRHSTASILYDKGWEMKDIQNWLRHSSIDVTGDIYTHISEDRKGKMAAELNSTFKL